MCRSKYVSDLATTDLKSAPAGSLPPEVCEVLDAAARVYAAIGDHSPGIFLPQKVEQEWKRLGECLAWLQR